MHKKGYPRVAFLHSLLHNHFKTEAVSIQYLDALFRLYQFPYFTQVHIHTLRRKIVIYYSVQPHLHKNSMLVNRFYRYLITIGLFLKLYKKS